MLNLWEEKGEEAGGKREQPWLTVDRRPWILLNVGLEKGRSPVAPRREDTGGGDEDGRRVGHKILGQLPSCERAKKNEQLGTQRKVQTKKVKEVYATIGKKPASKFEAR